MRSSSRKSARAAASMTEQNGDPMNVSFLTTPGGEELALIPRAEFETLKAAAERIEAMEHAKAVADYRDGKVPGLTPGEALAFASAVSPLAFWRKRAGLTQGVLAERVSVTQNYLSDLETGKRSGPVNLWLKLSAALGAPIEVLVEEE
jgi:DNA-binding XRE family transcriptional regulator